MRRERSVICLECHKEFKTRWRNKFCGFSCSATYNNRNRLPPTEETKKKQRDGLLKYYAEHPEKLRRGEKHSKATGEYTKGKYKGRIESILDVSKRTASKILKRLNIGCCLCGWKEASCDIHHINGRKITNPHNHRNLTLLCPNHHRLFHEKKILEENVISLDKYFPENWRDLYYG